MNRIIMDCSRNLVFILIQTICLAEASVKPHILFIVADDLGKYNDFTFYRSLG